MNLFPILPLDSHVDFVGFSVEGLGKVNDQIRRGAKYSIIEKNIKYLLKLRNSSSKPTIFINMTKSSQSWSQIEAFVKKWLPLVDFVSVNPCLNDNRQIINPRDFFRGETSQLAYCSQPFSTMGIFYNGHIVGCCTDIFGLNIMGDAAAQSLSQIWRGQKYKQLRQSCILNRFPPRSLCLNCSYRKNHYTFTFKNRRHSEV
jgi:hypothetical protein